MPNPPSGTPELVPGSDEVGLDELLRAVADHARPNWPARSVPPLVVTAAAICSVVFTAGMPLQVAAWSLAVLFWLLWLAMMWAARPRGA